MFNESRSDLIGQVLEGRYRIIEMLGKGGMGAVFLAEDLRLVGKKWAIKRTFLGDNGIARFTEEAATLIKLDHPHLPGIIDYFPPNSNGYSYLVMDYIEGETLQQYYEKHRNPIPYAIIVKYSLQLCSLLRYLHQDQWSPIIYRDLKPANVMVDRQDQVKLIDFGIARSYKEGQTHDTVQIGSIGFAAPEQLDGAQTDQRSDLYALGALMYYLLSGGKYYYITQKPIREMCHDLPLELAGIVDKLLRHDPNERFQTADALNERIDSWFKGQQLPPAVDPSVKASSGAIERKLVIVGSLYSAAGSTFIAVAIAKALNEWNIPHTVVEFPGNEPELYYWLNGVSDAPANCYYSSNIREAIPANELWVENNTTWITASPDGVIEPWSEQQLFRLLYGIKTPVIIIDISACWEDPALRELIANADEICVVADSSPVMLDKPSTKQRIIEFDRLQLTGKSILWIANRDGSFKYRNDWLYTFPAAPVCIVPNIPREDVVNSEWRGKLVHDSLDWQGPLISAMMPLVEHLVPNIQERARKKKSIRLYFQQIFK